MGIYQCNILRKMLHEVKRFNINNSVQFWCLFAIYAIITFYNCILSGRIPNSDEAHAWLIAEHFNIFQIIEIMNNEGHYLLWYLVIMPFAKFNLFYPISIQCINWLFTIGAVYLIWKKSPFSTLLKIVITFSCPFLNVYPMYARCYSIGIFLLFLSACLYSKRLEHPYKYLIILVLCANTNMIFCFLSCILAGCFLYDLIKSNVSNKIILTIISILILNLILWYFQFSSVIVPHYAIKIRPNMVVYLLGIMPLYNIINIIKINLLRMTLMIYFILIYKSKKIFYISLFTIFFYLVLFSSVYYTMHSLHKWLLFILIIFLYWMYKSERNLDCKNFVEKSFFEIFIILVFSFFIFSHEKNWHGYNYTKINSNIFTNISDNKLVSILPYLEKQNIKMYDIEGTEYYSFGQIKSLYSGRKIAPDIDKIAQIGKINDIVILYRETPNLSGEKYIINLSKPIEFERYKMHRIESIKVIK